MEIEIFTCIKMDLAQVNMPKPKQANKQLFLTFELRIYVKLNCVK